MNSIFQIIANALTGDALVKLLDKAGKIDVQSIKAKMDFAFKTSGREQAEAEVLALMKEIQTESPRVFETFMSILQSVRKQGADKEDAFTMLLVRVIAVVDNEATVNELVKKSTDPQTSITNIRKAKKRVLSNFLDVKEGQTPEAHAQEIEAMMDVVQNTPMRGVLALLKRKIIGAVTSPEEARQREEVWSRRLQGEKGRAEKRTKWLREN